MIRSEIFLLRWVELACDQRCISLVVVVDFECCCVWRERSHVSAAVLKIGLASLSVRSFLLTRLGRGHFYIVDHSLRRSQGARMPFSEVH